MGNARRNEYPAVSVVDGIMEKLTQRIAELEAEVDRLRALTVAANFAQTVEEAVDEPVS